MPQMAPINWLSLFFVMSTTFLMFNLLNYFSFSLNMSKTNNNYIINKNEKNKSFNWKW
uniref:ATP synthase complex subunit 8 n=1 Tax=Dolichosciara megumiae TaxID=2715056 RepID=A0A6G7GC71_9DIPT|nr:ATP synthase F0 subunit 8 [Dolichosciara megumiae]QIH95780.1 ATP synthase F0 subunit 8 [Dolichosciara megumiae]